LKQQTQQSAKTTGQANHDDGQSRDTAEPAQKIGKRKRGGSDGGDNKVVKITRSNLDEMWKTHIEGRPTSTNGAQKKKREKKRVKTDAEKGSGEPSASTVNGAAVEAERKGALAGSPQSNAKAVTTDGIPPKKKNKNKKKNKGETDKQQPRGSATDDITAAVPETLAAPPPPPASALTPLQQSMRQKLLSARFRHLNETLYTTPSARAMELFSTNPEFFNEYHAGFSRQVQESWPSNPVDGYIRAVKERGSVPINRKPKDKASSGQSLEPLPRRPHGTCTIADLGCGDAQFARALTPVSASKRLNLKLLSFDLCATDPLITKADIAALPVEDGTVDVAIFCLSLMGTNWIDFVEEAWRVLRGDGKGECWVSEVKSRFGKVGRKQRKNGVPPGKNGKKVKPKKKKANADEDDEDDIGEEIFAENARSAGNGVDETDISAFVEVFRTRGFLLKQDSVDKSNKMFVKMEFVKTRGTLPTRGKHAVAASQNAKFGKKKFVEREDTGSGLTVEDESKVLKPCVYKIR
jgi:ribosomal RNA-processing protein 8